MIRFPPFGNTPLPALAEDNLLRLLRGDDQEGIDEGLFVEYKSAWASDKLARAVTSFANNPGGGTLILGVQTDGLTPVSLPGVSTSGDIQERAVQVIRSNVDPVPDYRLAAVTLENGNECLVIEVPEGTMPPYLYIRTGQILVRTPTSSEPVKANDRETIDRLFAKGSKGQDWARRISSELGGSLNLDEQIARIWTIPAVEHGVPLNEKIFRESFMNAVRDTMATPFAHANINVTYLMQQNGILVSKSFIYLVEVHVSTDGTIMTSWQHVSDDEEDIPPIDLQYMENMIDQVLPSHLKITEEYIGHRGHIGLVLDARVQGPGESKYVRVVRNPFPLRKLNEDAYRDALKRDINRAYGGQVFEPEPPEHE